MGIKVEPLENLIAPDDRVNDFSLSNVTETGSKKNGLDLNGVTGATIDGFNVSGTTAGTGIAITDSANVVITHSTTTNNAWGGIALYQHTRPTISRPPASRSTAPTPSMKPTGLCRGRIRLAGFRRDQSQRS